MRQTQLRSARRRAAGSLCLRYSPAFIRGFDAYDNALCESFFATLFLVLAIDAALERLQARSLAWRPLTRDPGV
jgi:hypothetical protein